MNLPVPNAYPQAGGRLVQLYYSWSTFTSDIWVLQDVRGYKIEFVCELFQVNKPHGTDEEKKLIDLEVRKMLQKGAIRRASFDPRQFNLFINQRSVAILGLLLILNLSMSLSNTIISRWRH